MFEAAEAAHIASQYKRDPNHVLTSLMKDSLPPVPNVMLQVPLLLIFVAAGAHSARLLRRHEEKSVCGADHDDSIGEKATPIDLDFKPFLLRYSDGLEDFGAAPVEQLHWVFDDGAIGFWLFWHLMPPRGIWVRPWIHR